MINATLRIRYEARASLFACLQRLNVSLQHHDVNLQCHTVNSQRHDVNEQKTFLNKNRDSELLQMSQVVSLMSL